MGALAGVRGGDRPPLRRGSTTATPAQRRKDRRAWWRSTIGAPARARGGRAQPELSLAPVGKRRALTTTRNAGGSAAHEAARSGTSSSGISSGPSWIRSFPLVPAAVLLGLAVPILLILNAHHVNGRFGFPLDDPWIHLTYARNLHDHHAFTYFPGDPPTQGSTSPLYTFLLALGFTFTRNEKLLSYVLGIISHGLFLVAFAAWARRRLRNDLWVVAAVLLVGLDPNLGILAASGMETSLFLALIALAFWARLSGRNRLLGIALGLAVWTRPDGLVLVAAFAIEGAVSAAMKARSRRALLETALPAVVLLVLYAAFNLAVGGRVVPNTVAAKTAFYARNSRATFLKLEVVGLYLGHAWRLIVPFAILAMELMLVRLFRRGARGDAGSSANRSQSSGGRALLLAGSSPSADEKAPLLAESLWALGLPLAYLAFLPFSHRFERYLVPPLPAFAILGLCGIRFVLDAASSRIRNHAPSGRSRMIFTSVAAALIAVALVIQARGTILGSADYTYFCQYTWERHERTGQWLAEHTPPGSVIAAHDVGAIAYYSGRKVIDIVGVVYPEAVSHLNATGYLDYLRDLFDRKHVTYLACLQDWLDVANVEPLFTADPNPEVLQVFPWIPGRTHLVPQEVPWLQQGALDALQSNDLNRAAGLLDRSLNLDRDNSRTWLLLGVESQSTGDLKEAERRYRHALELYPEFGEARLQLAELLATTGRSGEARDLVKSVLDRRPDFPGAADLLKRIGS